VLVSTAHLDCSPDGTDFIGKRGEVITHLENQIFTHFNERLAHIELDGRYGYLRQTVASNADYIAGQPDFADFIRWFDGDRDGSGGPGSSSWEESLGASLAAGLEGCGFGLIAIQIYKGVRNTIHNGLASDAIRNTWKKRYKVCHENY